MRRTSASTFTRLRHSTGSKVWLWLVTFSFVIAFEQLTGTLGWRGWKIMGDSEWFRYIKITSNYVALVPSFWLVNTTAGGTGAWQDARWFLESNKSAGVQSRHQKCWRSPWLTWSRNVQNAKAAALLFKDLWNASQNQMVREAKGDLLNNGRFFGRSLFISQVFCN